MEPKDLKNPDGLKTTKNSTQEDLSNEVSKKQKTEENSNQDTQEQQTAKQQESDNKTTAVANENAGSEEEKKEDTPDNTEEKPVAVEKQDTESKKPESEVKEPEKEKTEPDKKEEVEAKEEKPEEVPVEKKKKKESVAEKDKDTEIKPAVEKEKKIQDEKPDYTKYSQIELVNTLRDILDNHEEEDIKDEVESVKAAFYKNLKENAEEAKKKFIEEGGAEEDFVAEEDPYENDIKDLLKQYRQIRIEFNKKLEAEKDVNLQRKYEVIEKIKGLINNEESINKTFNEFRDLQREWREIGLVPQSKMKDLWETYHFHVENFYDYIKINRELRDLDLKKNLEAKIKLCERAEELLVEPSILKAFNTLQKYHEQWREIGPVPRENKDDIWERFKAATSKINKKHQEFFENRKVEQKKNLEAKVALCEKVEAINEKEVTNHRDWDERSKELIELQKVWRTIGFAPRKDNNKIYERFRTACDKFFDAKRAFYAKNKEEQQDNLQLKIDLCVQAESLKDSTDWKKTTQDFINIQKKWKEIGPVPRKHSDNVWKRFRAACDFFFEKKSEHFSGMDSEQGDNLKKKEELIKEIENYKALDDADANLKNLKEFHRKWTEIGHVPFKKKDEIQKQFRDTINKLYDELNLDEEKRNMLRFRTKMSSLTETSRGQSKMRFERDKYMNKMKQLENDLVLLDNNIGFFAESKNAESLIQDVQKKIEMTKQKIEFLRNKIRVIDEMDNSDD